MSNNSSGTFPTTAWSMIEQMQDPHSPQCVAAMNRCVACYWRPVFYYLRAKHYSLHQAEDLTQDFFLRFFEKNWIRPANPERGRFRSFLLTILKRFVADQSSARAPRQRTFDNSLLSISALVGDQDRTFEPAVHESPDDLFMRQWAAAVIDGVRRRLARWCEEQGRPDWHEIFSAAHFPPAGSPVATQQALAERFRLSRDQVRYGLEMANARFVALLREEVAEQVDNQGELDLEIQDLQRLLGH